ncbi:MAG: hypothetical protein ACE37F_23950 [Nannocystaceae bacterium]|nr:M23 family metallopeptidase [bacterium]
MQRIKLPLCLSLVSAVMACDGAPQPDPPQAGDEIDVEGSEESGDGSTGADDDSGGMAELDPDDVVGIVAYGGFDDRPAGTLAFTADDLPDSFTKRGPTSFTDGPDVMAAGYFIPEPVGYGHYCSMVWPGGGWAFASDTSGGHPCQYLRDTFGSGAVRRAGMFSATGTNQAVVWCDGQTWGPAIYRGQGIGPLDSAYSAAVGAQEPECVITVSPQRLPIFASNPGFFDVVGTGVDFARDNGPVLDTGIFGATGANDDSAATQVNFRGNAKNGWVDNHDGWDWIADEGTSLFTMANGYVLQSRDYQTTATACPTEASAKFAARQVNNCINRDFPVELPPDCSAWNDASTDCQNGFATGDFIEYRNEGWDGSAQGEVYVRHRVQTNPSEYSESFVVGYFHVDRADTPAPYTAVGSGTKIGEVANTGWTSTAHLHMTVIRETNVGTTDVNTRWFSANPDTCSTCPGGSHEFHQYAIDPFGWAAPLNIDPRGWVVRDGAMSVNLWTPNWYHMLFGYPPTGEWGA